MSTSRPIRTCVGCRRTDERSALRRYVRADRGLVLDEACRAPGRGAWVHPDRECWTRALRGGFARSFRAPVNPDAVDRTPFGR
ncbi:YlxR family protein [uncultured Propionibacterium sp.]|uniref:YlxR family protein n=1 Tax=uncultured Propionibacterium sp. TaxID=218066 RepID=UPI0029310689|nr:YlxR family protein [uncultured Propionibacterium sp.]